VLQAEERRIVSGLERSHEAELARRQAAAQAIAQWAQTQQVINAMNRPVTTNCTNLGSGIVNCVSQ
jgi:phage terminase Nu1 subunit (DNA packaging protein)